MIVRFAYTENCPCPNGYDAAPNVVQNHLGQLAPHLRRNKDVIVVVQSGFVGRWGEGYYSTHFGNEGNVSTAQWNDRKKVVDNSCRSSKDAWCRCERLNENTDVRARPGDLR
jgi:hypothetical protein